MELKLGYNLTPNFRVTVGYDLLYWSVVARPGEQISRSVNLTGTTPAAPVFTFHESDLWVQGISIGGDLRF
jgi:hypothetical protein